MIFLSSWIVTLLIVHLLPLLSLPCSSFFHDRWLRQTGSWYEDNNGICNFYPSLSSVFPLQSQQKEDVFPSGVSSVNVGSVCLCKVSTWFMHKSAARWSQVLPWCTASGDLATGAMPLRWRIEPAATKQIWNHATLCHNFLHPTEVTWNAREPFSPICELKTLKRWASLAGGTQKQEERGCEPLRLCMWHRYLRCMTPVAISNIYTLTCVSQTTKWGFNL